MSEERAVFKSYLRGVMRNLKELEQAIKAKDFDKAEKLVGDLIKDTQRGIED